MFEISQMKLQERKLVQPMGKPNLAINENKLLAGRSAALVVLWALGLASLLVSGDNRAVSTILPAISDDLQIRESTAGLLITAYALPYGLFQLVYGPIADRFGKLRTITVAMALFSIGSIGCGLASSYESLFVLRFITGMFAAGIIPVALAHIGDTFDFRERPKAISLFMSFSTSGQMIGILLGAMVAQFLSWKWLFILIGLAGIPAFLVIFRQKVSQGAAPAAAASVPLKERYLQIWSNSRSRLIYLLVFVEGCLFYGGVTYLSIYGNQDLHLPYLTIGLLAALVSLSSFIGSRWITRTLAVVGQKNMAFLGAMLMTAAFAAIWLIPAVWSLALGFLLLGVGFSFLHSTLQTFATELMPEARGTAMSLFAFSLFGGAGIGSALLGFVYEWGGAVVMLGVTAGCLFLFSLLCRRVFRGSAFQ